MLEKCVLISFVLMFIFLYLYVKVDSFYSHNTPSTPEISNQLTLEISRVLGISSYRIINVIYNGDISTGQLNVGFKILEGNTGTIEKNAKDSAVYTNDLMENDLFKVNINNISVSLNKILQTTSKGKTNIYFDNTGLNDISDYSKNKYISAPNDESLTNFFKLGIDDNFNIIPQL